VAEYPILDENGEIIGYIDGLDLPAWPGGWIDSWAYNSIPGEGLYAGQIPEPATVALLAGLGALGVALLRRRRMR
jgi:hypothetical protein